MEGRWGKLQRKGVSPNQKAEKCGLETDNSKVCFQAETQQPRYLWKKPAWKQKPRSDDKYPRSFWEKTFSFC